MVSPFTGSGFARAAARTQQLDDATRRTDLVEQELQAKNEQFKIKQLNAQIEAGLASLEQSEKLLQTGKVGTQFGAVVQKRRDLLRRQLELAGRGAQADILLGEAAAKALVPEPQKPFTLSPGETRFGPDSQPVASVAPLPKEPRAPSAIEQKFAAFKRETGRNPTEPEALNMLGATAKEFGFTLEQGADGKIRLTGGTGAQGATNLPSSVAQDVNARILDGESALAAIDAVLELPQGSLGVVGKGKRIGREVGRIAIDVASAPIPERLLNALRPLAKLGGDVAKGDPDGKGVDKDPLTTVQGFQSRLKFMYARALQPNGKLLKTTLDEAQEATDISGFLVSEPTARSKLSRIREVVGTAVQNLKSSVPRVGGQAPVATPAAPATAAPAAPAVQPSQRFRFDPETGKIVPVR